MIDGPYEAHYLFLSSASIEPRPPPVESVDGSTPTRTGEEEIPTTCVISGARAEASPAMAESTSTGPPSTEIALSVVGTDPKNQAPSGRDRALRHGSAHGKIGRVADECLLQSSFGECQK